MLATAIIVFREVLEAALIVGIVMAATQGVPNRSLWVGGGIVWAVLATSGPPPCSRGACQDPRFAGRVRNANKRVDEKQ